MSASTFNNPQQTHVAVSLLGPATAVSTKSQLCTFTTYVDALPIIPASIPGLEPAEDLDVNCTWYNNGADAIILQEQSVCMMVGTLTVKDGTPESRPELSLRVQTLVP